jgi:uncharacterized membrane protein YedE/YeeE
MDRAMNVASAFGAGLLFGIGLIVGGMTRPAKVIGFLDVTGDWDPSLAFVMGGALAVHLALYRLIRRRPSPLLDARFHVPTRRDVDVRLVAGAALFGAGWGLAGFCPGPALVSAASGPEAALFVAAMLVGMYLFKIFDRLTAAPRAPVQVVEQGDGRAPR